jgi:hypothetical protein
MRLLCPTCLGVGHIAVERHIDSAYEVQPGNAVVYPICATCGGLSWLYEV